MNYRVFEADEWEIRPDESAQEHMARIFQEALAPDPEGKRVINDMLGAVFLNCDVQEKTLTLKFHAKDWMNNPNGTLHGGLLATASDVTMGMLTRYYKRQESCVTVQMSVNYLRSIEADADFYVCARAEKVGRRVLFLRADVFEQKSAKKAGEVTAVFM